MASSSRRSRSHSIIGSPTNASSKRAFSLATSPRARGKRPRRDSSYSPISQFIVLPVASSSSAPPASSTSTPLAALPTNLASSVPPASSFPSTSAAFFPSNRSCHTQPDAPVSSPPFDFPSAESNIDELHREAFVSLRRSVAESGEGFVKRMRQWEQRRHLECSESSIIRNDGDLDHWHFSRVRRNRRARVDRLVARSKNSSSFHTGSQRSTADRLPPPELPSTFSGQEETDDEYDILADSTTQRTLDVGQHRNVSCGDQMDIVDSPALFDVELADSGEEPYSAPQFTAARDISSTYLNTRSSSPFSIINTSDDESSYTQTHSGFSSPRDVYNSSKWARNANFQGHLDILRVPHPSKPTVIDSPDTSPLSTSPRLSNAVSPYSFSHSPDSHTSHTSSLKLPHEQSRGPPPQTASEKALAALTLALANGSGSLTDYGSVRDAQGDLAEIEAGDLWT